MQLVAPSTRSQYRGHEAFEDRHSVGLAKRRDIFVVCARANGTGLSRRSVRLHETGC